MPVIQASTCKEFISLILGLNIFEDPENFGRKWINQSICIKNSGVSLIFLAEEFSLNKDRIMLTKILTGLMHLWR